MFFIVAIPLFILIVSIGFAISDNEPELIAGGTFVAIVTALVCVLLFGILGLNTYENQTHKYQIAGTTFISYPKKTTTYNFTVKGKDGLESKDYEANDVKIIKSDKDEIIEKCKHYVSTWWTVDISEDTCQVTVYTNQKDIK